MGNHFTVRAAGLDLSMSNGGTSAFCDVIALAGSTVARTPWQQNLVLHFCDTERYSYGFGGFDLGDLPWTPDCEGEQQFFLDLLTRAEARQGWDRLHYLPTIDHNLNAFTEMLEAFRAHPTPESPFGDWTAPPNPHYLDLCVRHGIFQGEYECRLCDTSIQPIDAPIVWELISQRVDNALLTHREFHQLSTADAAHILAPLPNPASTESRSIALKLEPAQLNRAESALGIPLDPALVHWVHAVIA